jgi:cyclopropane fatty-acyl-phospholipid synthase-like methyltransferase
VALTDDELRVALSRDRYPRASTYDPAWVLASDQGPNVLWQMESLAEDLRLEPGRRVLDLGCGNAYGAMFLAREFGVTVFAVDSLIRPAENWKRVEAEGLGDLVVPLRANATSLPFPPRFFDAIVSTGAFQYFATEATFPRQLATFLRPGGDLGFVIPGVHRDIESPPDYFGPEWRAQAFDSLRTPQWWRRHFERTGEYDVVDCSMMPDGYQDWVAWRETLLAANASNAGFLKADLEVLHADGGDNLDLVRFVARRRDQR